MFTWLNNLFPYSDLHSLNLDWILSKMKETAAQAAKAIADSANALAQVAEAKAAALTAQTAAQDAQTAANKAAGNAASAAANAVQALNAAQTAQETATAANSAAQTAQETATAANNKAQTAQETATAANSAAQTAQETATAANSTANTLSGKFPIKNNDIANAGIPKEKFKTPRISIRTKVGLTIQPNSISNVYDITYTNSSVSSFFDTLAMGTYTFSIEYSIYDGEESARKRILLNPILLTKSVISPAFYYDKDTETITQGTLFMNRSGNTVHLKLNFPQPPDLSSITDPKFKVEFYFVYPDMSVSAGI